MTVPASTTRSGPLAWYGGLPRSVRWLVLAGLGIGAYFLVVEPVIDATVKANGNADAMAARIRAVNAMGQRAQGHQQLIALGSRLHGEVELPGPRSERATALNRAVDRALRDAGVSGARTQTSEQNLADGPATQYFGGRGSLVKLVSTLSFDASPEAFSTVLGALEASPDVAAVTRVIVLRADDGSRQVSATLTVEAWALGSKARETAGGAS
ncbi:MAG: type II secretion system protein M [Phycisphaera sp.]|nr:MAG: type II secretion system protein M [Phycisphaera sp.]